MELRREIDRAKREATLDERDAVLAKHRAVVAPLTEGGEKRCVSESDAETIEGHACCTSYPGEGDEVGARLRCGS